MPTQPRRVLLQVQLLTSGLPSEGVIEVSGLLADEVDDFEFLLVLGHSTFFKGGRSGSTQQTPVHGSPLK